MQKKINALPIIITDQVRPRLIKIVPFLEPDNFTRDTLAIEAVLREARCQAKPLFMQPEPQRRTVRLRVKCTSEHCPGTQPDEIATFLQEYSRLINGFKKQLQLILENSLFPMAGLLGRFQDFQLFNELVEKLEDINCAEPNRIIGMGVLQIYQSFNQFRQKALRRRHREISLMALAVERLLLALSKACIITHELNRKISGEEIVSDQLKKIAFGRILSEFSRRELNEIILSYMNQQKEAISKLKEICKICEQPVQIEKLQLHLRFCEMLFHEKDRLKEVGKGFAIALKKLNGEVLELRGRLRRIRKEDEEFRETEQFLLFLERFKFKFEKLKKKFTSHTEGEDVLNSVTKELSAQPGLEARSPNFMELVSCLRRRNHCLSKIKVYEHEESKNRNFMDFIQEDSFDMSPRSLKAYNYEPEVEQLPILKFAPKKMSKFSGKVETTNEEEEKPSAKLEVPKGKKKDKKKLVKYKSYAFDQEEEKQPAVVVPQAQITRNCRSEGDVESMSGNPGPGMSIGEFELIRRLGNGAYGSVFLVRRKATHDYYAMKMVEFNRHSEKNKIENLRTEHKIFSMISGEYLVKAPFSFTANEYQCFVMEYMRGGDLGDLLKDRVYLSETEARFYIAEIVLAIEHLHSLNIIHRDLKPENLVIDDRGHLKLTDFGLSDLGARKLVELRRAKSRGRTIACPPASEEDLLKGPADRKSKLHNNGRVRVIGTPDYIAPQIFQGVSKISPTVDWWSLGVITYQLLIGDTPFSACTIEQIFQNAELGRLEWPEIGEGDDMISPTAKDFIEKLLVIDFEQRLGAKGAAEVKAHAFFKDLDWQKIKTQEAPILPENSEEVEQVDHSGVSEKVLQTFAKGTRYQSAEDMSLFRVDILRSETKVDPERKEQMESIRKKFAQLKQISDKLKKQ